MRLSLLVQLLADAVVDLFGRLLIGVGLLLLLLLAGSLSVEVVDGRIWCRGRRGRRHGLGCGLLRGALFVDLLLGFGLLALAFIAALFVFDHVLTELAFLTEKAAIRNGEFGLLFFIWHDDLSDLWSEIFA